MSTKKHITDVQKDVPDTRDFIYQPALIQLAPEKKPPENPKILNQGREGACTGFALAAVINQLNRNRQQDTEVSARMLYEMAKRHDEWPGESYEGSSVRAAINGWKNMGVCSDAMWPYRISDKGMLTIEAAKDARNNTVGAYFRLLPSISHFHCALNEAGVILASASVHKGWDAPPPETGEIVYHQSPEGGHAFAIVGYNDRGFWIQNSWKKSWGKGGLALWSYEDWIENIWDAWVVRLALPTPGIFGKQAASSKLSAGAEAETTRKATTPRADIAGHFVHIDDGKFHESGRYWSNAADIEQTAEFISDKKEYKHLLIYAHGGLNSPKASAARIKAMKEGFKRNGIYPFHIMYDTGLAEELKDLIFRKGKASQERVGGFSDLTDRFLEGLLRKPGTLIWDEMKQDADDAFDSQGAGTETLKLFIKYFRKAADSGIPGKKIHLAGHSTGGIVIAHLLRAMQTTRFEIDSCSLLAPACTVELYDSHYLPILRGERTLKLKDLHIYNLVDEVEKDDQVGSIYRKSLLYLVSQSFERGGNKVPLLGLENHEKKVTRANGLPVFHHSNGATGTITRSSTHGGFDNDPVTMNHLLKTVLGSKPDEPFTKEELSH